MRHAHAIFFGAVLTAAVAAHADENNTPAAVKEAFAKAYPEAADVEYERETKNGKAVYEVEFKHQGQDMEALYTAEGTLLRIEVEIGVDTLPEPVRKALAATFPNARPKDAERLMNPDGTVFGYEVELKAGGVETTVELDSDGKIVSTESDSEDD